MNPLFRTVRLVFCVLLLLTVSHRVDAQSTPPPDSLAGALFDLASRSYQFVGLPADLQLGDVRLLTSLAAIEGSTAPYGSSTGGFTFTFDPQVGVWIRAAPTFGPAFAERSNTIGKGKFGAGFNWLHSTYDSVAGLDLDNGELQPVRNSRGPASLPIPEYSAINLNLSSDAFVVFANYGVTDRFDLGLAVPIIRHSFEGQLGIFRNDVDLTGGTISFPKTTSSGLGDVAIRGKLNLLPSDLGGLAALIEVSLPSGDYDNFRGLGFTRTHVSGIWSRKGRVSPHVNVGYEFWSEESPVSVTGDVAVKDQVKYAAGVEFEVNPRATVLLDVVGRRLRKGGQTGYQSFEGLFGPGTSLEALVAVPGGLDVVSIAPGFKWNAWRSMLVTGNVLISVKNDGLRARTIPVFGLDWAF